METFYHGNNLEDLLMKVLKDMEPYVEQATLIGGWLPYIYHTFVWNSKENPQIVGTKDIDFALKEDYDFKGKVIDEAFSSKDYYEKEKIYDLDDTPYCIVAKTNGQRMKVDFLSHEYMDPTRISKITGTNIEVAPVGYIEYMIKDKNTRIIDIPYKNENINIRIPLPATYMYVKGLSCGEREIKQRGYKFKKDLWAIYFVLGNIPDNKYEDLIKVLIRFQNEDKEAFRYFLRNIKSYFKNKDSDGPKAVVELTSLPEKYVVNHAVELANKLIEKIKV